MRLCHFLPWSKSSSFPHHAEGRMPHVHPRTSLTATSRNQDTMHRAYNRRICCCTFTYGLPILKFSTCFGSNVWEEGRMVRDGSVLGFSSRVSENVQKGWIPLSDSTPVRRTSFSGIFGPSAESETEMPGFEIVCQDGEVARCACSSEEEADEIVEKIVAWSKEKRPQMSSTAAKLRQKYNTSSPSVQGGNRSTGERKAVVTSSLFPPPPPAPPPHLPPRSLPLHEELLRQMTWLSHKI